MFGVSRVTVSRALRRTGQVKPELEKSILAAARQHGYSEETNFTARALRHRREDSHMETNVVCAVVPIHGSQGAQPFHRRLLEGIERCAEQGGDELIITVSGKPQLPRVVVRRQVDGVIWLLSEDALAHLDSIYDPRSVPPMVSVLFTLPRVDAVAADDHGAMRAMGEYLARQGHRRVAFLGTDSELGRARLAGLRAGLAGAGGSVNDNDLQMKPHVMGPDKVLPMLRALMERRQALPAAQQFTALAAYNDYIALIILRALRDEYGLRVPRDLSVTGFDALDLDPDAAPTLTTAAMPLEELGAEAVRMIDWRMRNPHEPPRRVVLPAPLVEGESVGEVNSEQCTVEVKELLEVAPACQQSSFASR